MAILEQIAKNQKKIQDTISENQPEFLKEDQGIAGTPLALESRNKASILFESARSFGEQVQSKTKKFLGKSFKSAVSGSLSIFESISRVAGGLLKASDIKTGKGVVKQFRPEGREDETIIDIINRQPLFGDVIKEKLEQSPIIKKATDVQDKIPGIAALPTLPVAAGFIAEFLLPPYGPGGKARFVDDLAKATTKGEIKTLLMNGIKDISEKQADNLADKLYKIEDTKIINQELESFIKAKETKITPELQPLAEEAGKFKTAEEFAFSVDERLKPLIDSGGMVKVYRSSVKHPSDVYKKDTFFATSPENARFFAESHHKGALSELTIRSIEVPAQILKRGGSTDAWQLKIDYPVSSPKIQLTDFFNQVKGKITDLGDTPAKTRKEAAKSIREKVEQVIPGRNLLQEEVAQELAKSEILSSLPPSKQNMTGSSIAEEFAKYRKAETGISGAWLKIRETFQDSFIRVRKLQEKVFKKGEPIPDDLNIDQARTLFDGRVHTRMEEVRETAIKIDKDLVSTARQLDLPPEELIREVDSFLHARHALERNKQLVDGAAGLKNSEAKLILENYKNSPRKAQIDRIAGQISDMNKRTLEILHDSEVISDDLYKLLTEKYQHHVPLQRVMNQSEDIVQVLTGRGFDVKGTGLRKAVGSDKPVADILTNVVANLEQAIIRSEKNLVDLTTLRFARSNKELGLFEELKPKVIGKTNDGRLLFKQVDDPLVLSLREKGNPVHLKINDKRLAIALKGVNVEKIPALFRGIASITRLYAGLHTRFNYEFAFSNIVRDVQEMAVYTASRQNMGFGSSGKSILNIPKSKKAILDFFLGKDTPGANLYRQMKLDGGTTGGIGLSTREAVILDIENIRKLNRSKPRKAARTAIELVDKWNTLFEDATRLSVYETAINRGLSRKQAANLAKEATLNFNKKGTAGPLINALYMFSNASIQGSAKILSALKNPKVLGAVVSSVGLAIYTTNEWNDNIDPNWRDKVTKWDRSSNLVIMLPEGEDGEINYITIPISWGLKPIKIAMEYSYDAMTGHGNLGQAFQGILTSILESYNPLAGDEDILNTLTPTILKTPMEIARNRAWYGNAIKPDYDPNVPASSKYFKSLENTLIGRTAINITGKLSEATKGAIEISPADAVYAFNQYIGGVGRSVNKLISLVSAVTKREELPARETPILSRFLKNRDEEEVLQSLYYSEKERADKEKARQKARDVRRMTPIYEEVQMLVSEGRKPEAKAIVDGLSEEDYEIYKKMKSSDKRRKNTSVQIRIMPTFLRIRELVNNGEINEARRLVNSLTQEEYDAYKSLKTQMGID